jgi:hypothetical protein
MEDPLRELHTLLVAWVEEKEKNGIGQHTKEWELIKRFSVGGSSMATLMGLNPFSKIAGLITDRVGITSFIANIKPQWGNLFEDVIKRCVEYECDCIILGEDLFIEGNHPTLTYSPDGLAAMTGVTEEMVEIDTIVDTPTGKKTITELGTVKHHKDTIVLIEFKCPFSRIPKGSPPVYYVPQVKMGLEILEIATVGLYIEAVYRRCTWEQLGNNPEYNKTLVAVTGGKMPQAYGIIGYYIDHKKFEDYLERLRESPWKITPEKLIETLKLLKRAYNTEFIEAGDSTNDYMSNDMGSSTVELFTMIMDAYDKKIISIWYGKIVMCEEASKKKIDTSGYGNLHNGFETVDSDVYAFNAFCKEHNFTNIGILPWKQFRIDYHWIEKSPGYIEPHMPKIIEIVGIVKQCLACETYAEKVQIVNDYLAREFEENQAKGSRAKKKQILCGFSDD